MPDQTYPRRWIETWRENDQDHAAVCFANSDTERDIAYQATDTWWLTAQARAEHWAGRHGLEHLPVKQVTHG